ncbi:MAG: YicC family protein [Acidobacteria bacterium]|nr:YicC family protein [Acidobacteriota bacterium]
MRSMTGFAETEISGNGFSVSLRIKSVNGRYLDCQFRLPDSFAGLEPALLTALKQAVFRGRVTVWMELRIDDPKKAGAHINTAVLNAYAKEFETIRNQFPMLSFSIPLTALFNRDANLLVQKPDKTFQDTVKSTVLTAFEKLLLKFNEGRQKEGDFLQKDFEKRLSGLTESLTDIETNREGFLERQLETFRARLEKILPREQQDESRIMQEAGLLADKLDITEELVRFRAHLASFRDVFTETGAVGKKLDFILQEMNREVNTIGSKSRDEQISRKVVLMKTELEKIREQVQNIE